MTGVEVVAISAEELKQESLAKWMGASSPELFREYLNPTNASRSILLAERFNKLVKQEEGIFAVKGEEGYLALAGYEKLDWDSRHFGIECARLGPYCCRRNLSRASEAAIHHYVLSHVAGLARRNGIKLLQRRLLSRKLGEIFALELSGFHLVDNVVTLCGSASEMLSRHPRQVNGIVCRPSQAGDLKALQDITRGAFPHSRFVTDSIFAHGLGDELYVKWLTGHFDEVSRLQNDVASAKGIIVASSGGKIAGYIAYGLDQNSKRIFDKTIGTIELIVLDPAFQGMGVGQNLLRHAAKALETLGATLIESSTWINQRLALASNQKAGLHVCENLLTYHLHL